MYDGVTLFTYEQQIIK